MVDTLYRTAIQSDSDPLEYVMSDETTDRYGDVISAAGWKLAQFKKNPIALFNHHADMPIGSWENIRTENGRLVARLKLAAEGTSHFVDSIRSLVGQRILRACSVGFRALKKEPLKKGGDEDWGPFRFLECELVECSLVAVPANPNALQISKALNLSAAHRELIFGVSASDQSPPAPAPRVSAKPPNKPKQGFPMKISDRIRAAQASLNELRDRLNALIGKDENELDEEEHTLIETLPGEIEATEKRLKNLEAAERALIPAGSRMGDDNEPESPAEPAPRAGQPVEPRRLYGVSAKKLRPADLLVRQAVCSFLAHATRSSPQAIQQRVYGRDEALAWAIRAAVDPAMTDVQGWAQELVQEAVADYMDLLLPVTVYSQLASRGVRLTFGRNGSIRIPSRLSDPNLAGSFIGEGEPIPVRRLGFTSINLTPKKMAVISTFTREMAMHSTPQIETLIRDAMVEDTAQVIDSYLLDNVAADANRPAGLLNGATVVPPNTTESDPLAMMADLKNLVGAIIGNTGGRVRNIVILINPKQALAIVTQQSTTGDFLFANLGELGGRVNISFLESGSVPDKTLVALDAADFVTSTGDTPEFDVSDQATLHMEDTTPLPIVGGGATPVTASPVRSLWQTASIGVRMIWDINWAMRRVGMVASVTGVSW